MPKTFLLIGKLGSIHIYNLVKNVLSFTNFEISAYNTEGTVESIPSEYLQLYNTLGIKIIGGHKLTELGTVKYLSLLYTDFSKLGKYDVVNIHYVSHYISLALRPFAHKFGKVILTFWGSDLLRSNKVKRLMSKSLIKKSDIIQVMTPYMRQYFLETKEYRKYADRITVLDFGDIFLDDIDQFKLKPDEIINDTKKHFGLRHDLPIVVIGYVGRPEMQQLKAVQSLSSSSIDKSSFQIALPVYGMNDNNLKELETTLASSGFIYKIFPEFMWKEEVVKFRCISDIFIHPQTSDALSSSMVECFYSESVVINGGWLKYDNIDSEGAFYHKFYNFDELDDILSSAISNLNEERLKAHNNREIIKQLFHWDILRPQWLSMYNR